MLKPALEAYFVEYDEHHRSSMNQWTHQMAIPLIVFHVIAMLSWISLGAPFGYALNLAHVVWLAATLWYLVLDVRLGLLIGLLTAMCFPVAAVTPKLVVVLLAIVGWLVQLVGHVVREKRQPAFLEHLLQALIGPLFFVAQLVGLWPARTATVTSH